MVFVVRESRCTAGELRSIVRGVVLMGSSTVRFALRFALCLLFTLTFFSCENGELAEVDDPSSSSATTNASSKPSHYGQMVEVSWDEPELKGKSGVRSQAADSGLIQYIRRGGGRESVPLLVENGTPTALASDGGRFFGGVLATSAVGVIFGGGDTLTYTWTFPDTDPSKPTLVAFRFYDGPASVRVTDNTVVIRHEFHGDYHDIFVNGVFYRREPTQSIIVLPSFSSSFSGPHSIEVSATGVLNSPNGTWNYEQKALRFTEEFPDYDLQSEEPVQIANGFEWDNGGEVVDPTWVVKVHNRPAKDGTGTDILANWDPANLVLTRATGQSKPQALRPGIRAQGGLEELLYQVEASAVGYPQFPDARYTIDNFGPIAGRAPDLKIIDEEVTPDPPFEEPGSSVTLTANIAILNSDLDPSQVDWTVDLTDPDGAVVRQDLAVGTGLAVSATWDGKIGGVAVEDPGSYSFSVMAQADCDEPPPASRRLPNDVVGRELPDGIRAQEDGCPTDQKLVAIDGGWGDLRVTVTPDHIEPSRLP